MQYTFDPTTASYKLCCIIRTNPSRLLHVKSRVNVVSELLHASVVFGHQHAFGSPLSPIKFTAQSSTTREKNSSSKNGP